MLLDKEVEIKWNAKNYKIYTEKGYFFTNLKDTFIVKLDDIDKNCSSYVNYICDYCGNKKSARYFDYMKNHNNKYIQKDCCTTCAHIKNIEIQNIKNELGLLNINNHGYWKKYETRLKELRNYLLDHTLDHLLDNGYSPILEAIRRNKDNIIDMVLELNINIYDKCKHLSRFVFYINENIIVKLINKFISKNNYFPSMIEIFEQLQINYVILAKYGGYYKFKNKLGYNNDLLQKLLSFEYSDSLFKQYNGISGIYKITNIKNGKVYIGKAVDLWHRITSGYLYRLPYNECHNKHLQRAWNKDGGENFYIEIVEVCEKEMLVEREQYWIDQTQCYKNKYGYNFKEESEENNKKELSSETRKKLGEICKNKAGWNHTKEVKEFLSIIKSIPIVQLDLDGNYLKTWSSAKEAGNFYNTPATNITNCTRGGSISAKGFLWVKKDEYFNNGFDINEHYKKDHFRKKVVQLDLNNNYIKTFRTITDAKIETNASNIWAVCKGIQHKSGGFKWMLEEDYLKLII